MSIEDETFLFEWDAELVARVKAGEDEQEAWADIVRECVDKANPLPLCYAIVRNRLNPAIARLIVAIFEEQPRLNTPVPVFVDRRPARRGARGLLYDEQKAMDLVNEGVAALDEVRSPPFEFWATLVKGFRLGHPLLFPPRPVTGRFLPPADGRIALTLKYRVPLGHKHPDPMRPYRENIFRGLVAQAMENDPLLTKDVAIMKVAQDADRDKNGKEWDNWEMRWRWVKRAVYSED